VLLDHLGLGHLRTIPWWAHEEVIADALMPQVPDRPTALAELAKAGVDEVVDREAIVDALRRPSTEVFRSGHPSLSTVLKLVASRVSRVEKEQQTSFDKQRAATQIESRGVPRADAKYRISPGRVCDQRHGKLDGDVARPPLPPRKADAVRATVYPTPAQADQIAGLLRSRVRRCVSIGTDERVFEGMLERRGIPVLAVDSDTFHDEDVYYERRIYCKEVRRVDMESLIVLQEPPTTALVFVNGFLCPWEGYLAHYPQLPLVLVIGDDAPGRKGHSPKPAQLEGRSDYRLLRRMPIDCHDAPPLTLAVYERTGS